MERNGDGTHYNRLKMEKSPYLLQHAENPVDWYPWSDEAFDRAARENKPVFLSIGYSTCHWCHVMARECFEDEEIAELMNKAFISVKVDREERPDIDDVYMRVCQMMTGSGGWPLSILMTAGKKPFFAATYIPKESRSGRIGMRELVPLVTRLWREEKGKVNEITGEVDAALEKIARVRSESSIPGAEPAERAYSILSAGFDERHGGFSEAPKFPAAVQLFFLMRYWKRKGEDRALDMAEKTLSTMRRGGIFDQLGYGFHRYSTDSGWLVPHFEKMLYDQALLMIAYTDMYLVTGNPDHRFTALQILGYVGQRLTSPEGGFYSAEDAESEGEEGRYYLWTLDEVESLLPPEDASLCSAVFGLEKDGNYRDELSGRKSGRNILHLTASARDCAASLNLTVDELEARLETIRRTLLSSRERRIRPHRDEKILTDWNGLMIAALSHAYCALRDDSFLEPAVRACDFVLGNLMDGGGYLMHRYCDGSSGITGYLADYAYFIWGLIELYEATFEARFLKAAGELNERLFERFWDRDDGGFFTTSSEGEKLPVRLKEVYDAAIPSGNSVAVLNLLRLHALSGKNELRSWAEAVLRAFSSRVAGAPAACCFFLSALDFYLGPSAQIVIAAASRSKSEAMLRELRGCFLPSAVVMLKSGEVRGRFLQEFAPYTAAHAPIDGKTACYICGDFSCARPTTDPARVAEILKEMNV